MKSFTKFIKSKFKKEAEMSEENGNKIEEILNGNLKNDDEEALEKQIPAEPTPTGRGIQEGNKPELTVGDDLNTDQIRGRKEPVSREVAEAPAIIDDPENNESSGLPITHEDQTDPVLPPPAVSETPVSQKEVDFGVLTAGHIARICHEANKELCKALGDDSQVGWDSAPAWQKESAMTGVKKFLSGEIQSPMDAHKSWCEEKWADGWKFGEVKDAEAKTHPCLVPYATLPPAQQSKDFLFASVCQGLGLFVKREG